MKRVFSLLLVFSILFVGLCGCTVKSIKKVKIGLAAPKSTHGWVAGVAYYAEKYCKENEIEYMITVSENQKEMEQNIQNLSDWGMDALVIWPQWTGMEEAVDKVIENEIPVVSFDVDISCDGICKVTGNNYDMGYQSAKYIVEKVGSAASIAVLPVPSAGSVSSLRIQGFYDYLEEIEYDTSNVFEMPVDAFTRECGFNDMKTILNEHKEVDAVFSLDDEVSIGIVEALAQTERKDIKAITGGGGMQEYFQMISSKKYDQYGLASVLYSPSMIDDAISVAIDIVTGNSSSKMVIIPTNVITKANVEKYIDTNNHVY